MPEREEYIPGVPCWVDTNQPDPEAALAFYADLFGWEFEDSMPPDSGGHYFIGRIRGGDVAAVSSIPEGAPPHAMWNTYIAVQSAAETAEKVREAGGTVLSEPFDVMDAGRMTVCADPEGAVFCAWEAKRHKGARVVNEAGSLIFNGLNTRDAEAAKRFYAAVFGWRTMILPGGFELWTLPGYGDHLERDNPGLRQRVIEMGGSAGFEDVVASLKPIPSDQPDTPAHWDVTFAVDDAKATAQKAAELGGTVLVAPFDAPWARTTVIADPQGATFIANQFVPENKDVGTEASVATS